MNTNKDRILAISKKLGLSHIGSCITAVDIIDEIFSIKKPQDKFVLSSGHAGLALYVVIEKYLDVDAEKIFEHHGVHPDRCERCRLDYSAGSLGNGLPAAVGMALADRKKSVYVLCSDGEMAEGSIYEALEIAHEQNLDNLKIYINCNGWGAYKPLDKDHLVDRCRAFSNVDITFRSTNVNDHPFLEGQKGHYLVLDKEEANGKNL